MFFKSKIGFRLSIYAVFLSLFFGILSVSVIFYLEYNKEQKRIQQDALQLIDTVKPQLAKSLWDFDDKSTRLLLESLEKSLFITSVRLIEPSKIEDEIFSDLKVAIKYNEEYLGHLFANYNYKEIKNNIISELKLISYVLVGIIVLMGLFFYLIVNNSLIRHIAQIRQSTFRNFYHSIQDFTPIKLSRKDHDDELSDLVEALNNGQRQSIELYQAKKDYQDQMEYQANFDLLTGLPNRRHLYNYLTKQVEEYEESMGHLIVMFIDLDGFKQVNDSLGHGVGDMVLKESANRIKSVVDEFGGYISRLGGDEFIVCVYVDRLNVSDIVARKIIDVFNKKVECHDIHVRLGCSIGITVYPDYHLDDPKELIRNADSALYQAKDSGKNTFFRFNEEMLEDHIFKQKVRDKLPLAIEEGLFEIHYQPLIDIQLNQVVGFEALLRWNDPDLGWVRPDIFIEIAEKMGNVFDIDTWVFGTAISQVDEWRKKYNKDFILSVNFSPTNFYHSKFFKWVRDDVSVLVDKFDWVELEVTERLMLNNDPVVFEGIREIRKKGIKFSIDDFGIGYSSLGYIKRFSGIFSKIKIDRLFINELLTEEFDIAFVKSIMMLSETLNMVVLAEGVEETEQVVLLQELGCKYAQGYHFSKPLPIDQLEAFWESWALNEMRA